MTQFLAISGSLRAASTNTALLRALAGAAPAGITVELFEGLGRLPIFNPDLEGDQTPPPVLDFARRVGQADGLILAVPEYAHGIPGGFKNALDWLVSRDEIPFKPVMLVHASHRGDHVLGALREVLVTISVRLMPGIGLAVPLLGKKPEEVTAILEADRTRHEMTASLIRFRDWIAEAEAS